MTGQRVVRITGVVLAAVVGVLLVLAVLTIANEPEDWGFYAVVFAVLIVVSAAIVAGFGAVTWAVLSRRSDTQGH